MLRVVPPLSGSTLSRTLQTVLRLPAAVVASLTVFGSYFGQLAGPKLLPMTMAPGPTLSGSPFWCKGSSSGLPRSRWAVKSVIGATVSGRTT